jgi:ABC-type multidrug transport system fused ATPase/permease subunit
LQDFVNGRGGLASICHVEKLSAGQRQLFSLARAVLRKRIRGVDSGILLLDEVSSSVDRATEMVMEEVIRVEFTRFTVVAVSHRLEMIMAFDRVIVMESGSIVEDGVPLLLAREAGSKFGQLIRAERQENTVSNHVE